MLTARASALRATAGSLTRRGQPGLHTSVPGEPTGEAGSAPRPIGMRARHRTLPAEPAGRGMDAVRVAVGPGKAATGRVERVDAIEDTALHGIRVLTGNNDGGRGSPAPSQETIVPEAARNGARTTGPWTRRAVVGRNSARSALRMRTRRCRKA